MWVGQHLVRNGAYVFGVSESTFKDHIKDDSRAPHEAAQSNRHPLLTLDQQEEFADIILHHGPILKTDLPAVVFEHFGIRVSDDTAHRYLTANGLKHYATRRRPPVRKQDFLARLRAANAIGKELDKILFVDESTVGKLHTTVAGYYGTRAGEHYHIQFPATLRSNTVGAVCSRGVLSLEFPAGGSLTAIRFDKCLNEILSSPRIKDWGLKYVVMDNSKIHMGKHVRETLADHQLERIFVPPYSPDLNPIEHVRANMKKKVADLNCGHAFTTITQLDRAAQKVWDDMQVANTFVAFRHTLKNIIDAKGAYTGG